MNDPRRTVARLEKLLATDRTDEVCRLLDAALDDAVAAGAVRTATTLLGHSVGPLVERGRSDWVMDRLTSLLDVATPEEEPEARGRLLAARAGLLRGPRRYGEALEDQTEAIALLEGRVGEVVLTTLRHDHAVLLGELGYHDDAVTGLIAARESFLGLRDRVGVAASDHNLGFVLHDLGSLDDAIEYLTEARDIFLAIDMPEEAASCDQNLGVVFYDAGRLAEAGRRFAVARHRFADHDATTSAAECDANLSTLLVTMGHPEEADRYRLRAERAGVGIPTEPGTSTQLPTVVADVVAQVPGNVGSASA